MKNMNTSGYAVEHKGGSYNHQPRTSPAAGGKNKAPGGGKSKG